MGKLFLFLLLLFAIYLFRRALFGPPRASRVGDQANERANERGRRQPKVERMIECAHCGLHVPEGEAVAEAGLSFCCEAHRQAYRARG